MTQGGVIQYPGYQPPPSVPMQQAYPGTPYAPAYPPVYPGTPGVPGYPAMPSMPSVPGYGNYGTAPSLPAMPSMPLPAMPSMPSVPLPGYGYAAQPSMPLPLSAVPYGTAPAIPAMPSMPLPGMPAMPGMPGAVPTAQQGDNLFTRLFGRDVPPQVAQPASGLQRALVRNFSAGMAVSLWAMAFAGAVVAAVVAVVFAALTQSVIASAVSSALSGAAKGSPLGNSAAGYASGLVTPNVLQILAVSHGVPLVAHLSASALGTNVSGDLTVHLPLSGLLLLPAVALTIGGYISAASDFQRRARYSIARGALIGPVYAVILAALAYFGTTTLSLPEFDGASATLGPSVGQAFLLGLLFGVVFGALGGWMQFAGGAFLSGALPTLRAGFASSPFAGKIAGSLAGAVAALICAIGIYAAGVLGLIGYATVAQAAIPGNPSTTSGLPGVSGAFSPALSVLLLFMYVPVLAIYLFAATAGGTVDVTSASSLGGFSSGPASTHSSYGLLTGQYPLPAATHQWFYLLALIPAICYLTGGRVAAKAAGARNAGDGFIAGALMAVPACLIFALAALLVEVGADISAGGLNASGTVGPAVGATLLAVLVGGAIVGGIGGASAVLAPWLGVLPRVLAMPLKPVGLGLDLLLDALSGRPRTQPRGAARQWVHDALLVALVLTIAGIVLDILNTSSAQTLPFKPLILAGSIVAALLLSIPILLLAGALVTAFSTPTNMLAAQPAPGYAIPGYPAVATLQPGYAPLLALPAASPLTGPVPVVPYSMPLYAAPPSVPLYAAPPSAPVPYPPPATGPVAMPYMPQPVEPPAPLYPSPAPDAPGGWPAAYPDPAVLPFAAPPPASPDPASYTANPYAAPVSTDDASSAPAPADPFSRGSNDPSAVP